MSRDSDAALRAKRRDGMECVKCGWPGDSSSLHAHHIVPRSHGGPDETDNLATLCIHCHRSVPDDRFPKRAYRPLFADYKRTDQRPEMDLFMFGLMMDDAPVENLEELYQGRFAPKTLSDYWLLFAACAGYGFTSKVVSQYEISPPASERGIEAIQERIDNGHDQGRPPFGLTYNDAGERWVPARAAENGEKSDFQQALDVIEKRKNGLSWRDVAAETSVNKSTARRVWDRRDRYLQEVETV